MNISTKLQHKIDFKTKPLGALGKLELLAHQIGKIQNTLSPQLLNPNIIVFAGDHGIANEGVSAYPQAVTYQMVLNFLQGGAAINVFCKTNNIALTVVDAGVNFEFGELPTLVNAKIGNGTRSFLTEAAMTSIEVDAALAQGGKIATEVLAKGSNCIGFGEMGIGNTSSATMLMTYLCGLDIADCVGRGTGLDDAGLATKISILRQAQTRHGVINDPKTILQTFGGFEIAQMCGAFLSAFDLDAVLLVDGFIASAAFLVAYKMKPEILENAVFCHLSDEHGHKNLLNYLNVQPILHLNMRLGEGTGCAMAMPILQNAVAFMNDMASFESSGVTNK